MPKRTQQRTYKTPTRAAKPEVNRILRKLRGLGLDLEFSFGAGHWRVIDPGTGAFLTTVSNTPSDRNWWHHIRRAVEKAGFKWDGQPRKHLRRTAGGRIAAVDLQALAHAQRMARIHGEREPQIEDLADKDTLTRVRRGYSEQESEEAIAHMPPGVESARAHRVMSRLLYLVEQRGTELANRARQRNPNVKTGAVAHEIAHVAQQVATKRGLRYWKSHESALQGINGVLNGTGSGMTIWVANLLEATMDELDGLRWDEVSKPEVISAAAEAASARPRDSRSGAPVVSLAEAKTMILDALTRDSWTLSSDLYSALVPEYMAGHKYKIGLKSLWDNQEIERMREPKKQGGMLYKLPAVSASEPEPTPEPEPEPELVLEPEPTYAAVGEGDVGKPEEEPEPLLYDESPREIFVGVTIADRYASTLLAGLEKFMANGAEDWRHVEPILSRLDKLAGISSE